MEGIEEFNRLLGQRIKELLPVQNVWTIAKEIDWNKKTMTCTGVIDSLDYFEVLLGLGSEFKKPKIGCKCLIGIIGNNESNAFLIYAEELDEIEITDSTGFKYHLKEGVLRLNGDNLGGIVNAIELKNQVDKNTELLEAIKNAFQSWIPVPEDGGAALKASSSSFVGLPTADLSNIQNEKIKHGG